MDRYHSKGTTLFLFFLVFLPVLLCDPAAKRGGGGDVVQLGMEGRRTEGGYGYEEAEEGCLEAFIVVNEK